MKLRYLIESKDNTKKFKFKNEKNKTVLRVTLIQDSEGYIEIDDISGDKDLINFVEENTHDVFDVKRKTPIYSGDEKYFIIPN